VPTFIEQTGVRTACSEENPLSLIEGSWSMMVVWSFQNLTGNPHLDYMTIGFITELVMEITRYQDVRVLMYGLETQERPGFN